jgi:predicted Zn-dependent protease
MRRLVALALLIAGCVALYFLQRAKSEAPISPAPVLYLVADTEREAERIPLAVTRVSDAEENQIGADIAKAYGLTDPHRFDNDKTGDAENVERYLNTVGSNLSAQVQRSAIHYHFYLENEPSFVNAFALPGGNIVVGRGLLNLLESEDELAAVLGHEITHVDNRHAIERLQYELAAKKIGLRVFYQLGSPAVEIFRAGYSKEQELEADRVGLDIAVARGYSPQGGIALMKRFRKIEAEESSPHRAGSPVEEIAQVSLDSVQQYFRSHPPASERLAAMQSEIASQGWPEIAQRPLSIRAIFLTDQAEALDASGDFAKSIAKFKEALAALPNYVRAWHGLAEAAWRSGDAAETVRAADEAARRGRASRDWQLLSRALMISEPRTAVATFNATVNSAFGAGPSPDSYFVAKISLAGMRYLSGDRSDADQQMKSTLSAQAPSAVALRTQLLRELAWWMYRAGNLPDAAKTLEDARQALPQQSETVLQLAWVYTDMARQADAQQSATAASRLSSSGAENDAVLAVIAVRTNEHSTANDQFQSASEQDPAWMVTRWVQNNFSNSTAGIIKQLETEELARRKKIADELARQKKEADSRRHPQN